MIIIMNNNNKQPILNNPQIQLLQKPVEIIYWRRLEYYLNKINIY